MPWGRPKFWNEANSFRAESTKYTTSDKTQKVSCLEHGDITEYYELKGVYSCLLWSSFTWQHYMNLGLPVIKVAGEDTHNWKEG